MSSKIGEDTGSSPVRLWKFVIRKYRGVEQLVARQAHNLKVARSSRVSATNWGISSVGRVPDCGSGGRRFESVCIPYKVASLAQLARARDL